jgi:S1-C subfamily serine protease
MVLGFRVIPIGGDIIFQVDSVPVSTLRDILDYVSEKKVGDTVTFHFYRGKTRKTLGIKLVLPSTARAKSL